MFGSQAVYVTALAGIVCAMLLLGERPASGLWVALGLVFAGLLLVEPRREPDEVLDVGVFGSADRSNARRVGSRSTDTVAARRRT